LTTGKFANMSPVWSPDGSAIAFASNRSQGREIYIMAADGTDVRRLTYNPDNDLNPVWVANGQMIAFVSGRAGQREMFMVGLDGQYLRQLTTLQAENLEPALNLVVGAEIQD
jgi:Tol biopolymer transport system component